MSRPCLVYVRFNDSVSGTNSVSDWVALNSGWTAESIIVDAFNFEYSQRNHLFLNVIQPEPPILT